MSDAHEDVDMAAEDALDALLADHQRGLLAAVGPALDTEGGLRQAMRSDSHGGQSVEVVLEDPANVVVRSADGYVVVVRNPSGALNGALDAVSTEVGLLKDLATELLERGPDGPAPGYVVHPASAAVAAAGMLEAFKVKLAKGLVTSESAASAFNMPLSCVRGQLDAWGAVLESAPLEAARLEQVLYLVEAFTVRLNALRSLKKRIVRLFEDAEESAFQLS
ncbi:hypothetical protein [Streptomyces sp. NPDC089919]|uniref:hypothetical protein n=1 Tax=Streptomyces sp. NPDC089919 TaxID=3155188 RepID=UPI00341D4EF5